MAGRSIASVAEALLVPVIAVQGVEFYDLEYVKEGGDWILRLYIDKEGGVGLNDCERVSRAVEAVLDAHDPIPTAYMLEVSSPGIERLLRKDEHFARYVGERVEVRLYKTQNGKKRHQGILEGLADGIITLKGETEMRFNRQDVSQCRLVVDLDI